MDKIEVFECDFSILNHCAKLVELMNDYIDDEMGGGEPHKGESIIYLINGLKAHPSKLILFASVNQEIVGLANCFINFSTFSAKHFINIHDLIVKKQYRCKGIGQRLLETISKKAEELKCSKITLEVREDNQQAQNLYKKLGFDDSEPKMLYWTKYL
jgi:ribosomal protein S18 acetylase RimI-like enzyme